MYYITQIGEKLNPEPYPALIRRFSQHIPVPVHPPNMRRSCSAYLIHRPVSTDRLRNGRKNPIPEISVLPTVDVRSFEIPDFNINQIFATIYSSNVFPSNRIISSSSAASYKALCTSVYLQLPDSNCIIGSTP